MHENLKSIMAEAKPFMASADNTKPIPLVAGPEKSAPYPVNALPDEIRDAVCSYQDYGQQPVEMVAMSAIACTALACQGLANVARDRQLISPLSLSMIVSAESGERKTSGDRMFFSGARGWQKEKREEMRDRVKLAEVAVKMFESQKNGLLSQIGAFMKKGRISQVEELKRQLEQLELTAPKVPPQPCLFYEDLTQEGMLKGLANDWPTAAVASDEGGLVVGGHSLREEKATQFYACMNRLWDGNPYMRTRADAASFHLYGRRLSCYLMMQASVLRQLLGDGQSRGIGYLARSLFAEPESTMGTRLYKTPPLYDPYLDAFNARIRRLLDTPLPLKEDSLELQLPTLYLSAEAHVQWVEYYNAVEKQLGKLGDYETVKDFASKSAENAARLAGNFHVFCHGPHGEISADTMRRATMLARWHLNETRRIFLRLEQPQDITLAQALWDWIVTKELTTISLKEILQYGPSRLRDVAKRDMALRKLVEHGYLIEQQDGKRTTYHVHS
jgi:hypothetical protein